MCVDPLLLLMVYKQKGNEHKQGIISHFDVLWFILIQLAGLRANTYGILDRWSVAEGGNIFWKFFEPGFLKRCRGEFPKSFVSPWSSSPSRGSCTVWCLERVTRIILPYIFCPLRWLMAEKRQVYSIQCDFTIASGTSPKQPRPPPKQIKGSMS